MLSLDRKQIAERLKSFMFQYFDGPADLARQLDISHQSLQSGYLSGRSIPGPDLLVKLSKLGCDIIWLLTDIPNYWINNNSFVNYEKRIVDLVEELKKKYPSQDDYKSVYVVGSPPQNTVQHYAVEIIKHWINSKSLSQIDLSNLAVLLDVSLFWILTGYHPNEKIDVDYIFSPDPNFQVLSKEDLDILNRLKLIPEYKETILKLIDSKVSEKEALTELRK